MAETVCAIAAGEAERAEPGGNVRTMASSEPSAHRTRAANLGQLKESAWNPVPVKVELRRNVAARIRAG